MVSMVKDFSFKQIMRDSASMTPVDVEDEGFSSPGKTFTKTNDRSFFSDRDSTFLMHSLNLEQDPSVFELMERAANKAKKARARKRPSPLRKAQSVPVLSCSATVNTGGRNDMTDGSVEKHQLSSNFGSGHKNPLECDGLIVDLSEEIGTSWKKLGSKLGVSLSALDSIEDEKRTNEERAFEVLKTWSRKEGNLANMRKLSTSLESIGRKDVAEKIPCSPGCYQQYDNEENLYLCVKNTRKLIQTDVMICEDKNTGGLFLVKQVDRSIFVGENSHEFGKELEDLHQRFTTTKLGQEAQCTLTRTDRYSGPLHPIQEVGNEDSEVNVQLAVCERLNSTLDNMYSKLLTLVGEIWNLGNSQVRKAVYEFGDAFNSEYNDLSQTLEELSTKNISCEDEKRLHCLEELHGRQKTKIEQIERLLSSVFYQEAPMRERLHFLTPEDRNKSMKRKRLANEGEEDEIHVSAPFMVQRTVRIPPKTKRSQRK